MGMVEVYCDRCGETVRARAMPDTTWEERVEMVSQMRAAHEKACAEMDPEYDVMTMPNGKDGLEIELFGGPDRAFITEFSLTWPQVEELADELERELEARRVREL